MPADTPSPAATARQRRVAEVLLATVALFWGATFPVVKEAVAEVPVLCFLWVRFAASALLLGAFAGRRLATLGASGLGRGALLGGLLGASYLFQTYGLTSTTAANAGFLTGLAVVWVPLLAGPLVGKPPTGAARLGVVFAVLGLWLLTGSAPWDLGRGDTLVAICSIFVALHILGLDAWTGGHDGRALAFVQIATMAVLALGGSLTFDPISWPRQWTPRLLGAVALTAVFATAWAFWVQTEFQRRTTPTRAALIYTLEPVFAALFAVGLGGESLAPLAWVGGCLIVAGMIAAEARPPARVQAAAPHGR